MPGLKARGFETYAGNTNEDQRLWEADQGDL